MHDNNLPTILLVVPQAERVITGRKFLYIGKLLQVAGYDPLVLCWDTETVSTCQEAQLPCVQVAIPDVDINVIAAARQLVENMTAPLTHAEGGIEVPTLGELYGYDDFLGVGKGAVIQGAGMLHPAAAIGPILGSEIPIAEDQWLSLMTWRFCRRNKIPSVGLQIASLRNELRLTHWPVDLLLTKTDPRTGDYSHIAPLTMKQDTLTRYMCSPGIQPDIDTYLTRELPQWRTSFATPGKRFLYMPFHLGYKERCIALLRGVNGYIKELQEANFELLISFDPDSHRRLLSEEDMIRVGLSRWLAPWRGKSHLIARVPQWSLALIADAVLLPCHSPLEEDLCVRNGITTISPGEEHELTNLALGTSPVDAVAYLLEQQKEPAHV